MIIKLRHSFFIGFVVVFCFISSFYIGLFWGGILGFMFAILCFSLLFQKDHISSFMITSKIEITTIAIFLLTLFIGIPFFLYKDSSLFVAWKDIVYSQLPFRFLFALSFPFVMGYMILSLMTHEKQQNYSTLITSFFVGILIMLVSFLIFDTAGIPKYPGMLFVGVIGLLLKIIKRVGIKWSHRGPKHVNFSISLVTLALFVFAVALYSSVYLNYDSFVKGDLWKQTATASTIQLGGLSNYFTQIEMGLLKYPSFFLFFLASTADTFSLPLINLAMILAIFISAVSVLATLSFFSAVEGGSQCRARWATLVWFTFSGFGMLYLLLEYGTLNPSADLMTTIMSKTGWGSGFIYSPTLGSFAHVLRLLSLAGVFQCHSMLIHDKSSLRKSLLASCTLIVAIVFHPLISILATVFVWITYLCIKPEVATRLAIATVLSLGVILFLEKVFSPVSMYYNNLSVLIFCIITITTLVVNLGVKLGKVSLRARVRRISNSAKYALSLLFRALLLAVVVLYIYSLIVLHYNYDMLHLERFPTVPFYAWPNILGLAGFLALVLMGVIAFSHSFPSFGEKYFTVFVTSVFLTSQALDYNNVHQVIEFFNPNLISFRLIPIVTIGISYLAGGFIHRTEKLVFGSKPLTEQKYQINIRALTIIGILLTFFFTSTQPRTSFWMSYNWPTTKLDFSISDEELLLIKHLRKQINEDEFVAVDGGQATALGFKLTLSGAKVISKELADVFFHSESIRTLSILRETLKIDHIVRKKHPNQPGYSNTGYAVDLVFRNEKPVFQTENYMIFQSSGLSEYMNETETRYFNISYPFHYGIFTDGEVRFAGNTKIHTDYLKISNFKVLNQSNIKILQEMNNITVSGIFKISLLYMKGLLNQSFSKNVTKLRLKQATLTQINIEEGVLQGTYDEERFEITIDSPCNVTGVIEPSTILANNPKIEVEGNVSLNDLRLTWPYIERIGPQGDVSLTGTVTFQVLSTYDRYITIRLTSFQGFKAHYQDRERNRLVIFNRYCYEILLLPWISNIKMRDLYTIFAIFLTFSLGYVLLVITAGKIRIYISLRESK